METTVSTSGKTISFGNNKYLRFDASRYGYYHKGDSRYILTHDVNGNLKPEIYPVAKIVRRTLHTIRKKLGG